MSELLIATKNEGKLRELLRLLSDLPYRLIDLTQADIAAVAAEEGHSLEENARYKAQFYHRLSGLPTLAEDSGLEVAALQGAPGVRSARFAGEGATDQDNIRLLLERLQGMPLEGRTARFRSVIAIAGLGEGVALFSGECVGVIATAPQGQGGFGYDPVFLVPELGRTFAQLSQAEKNRLSHRGQAARKAAEFLMKLRGGVRA